MPWPKGRPRSEETKRRISQANSGRPKRDEQRARMSASRKAFLASPAGMALRNSLSERYRGAGHPQWKGNAVTYSAAHYRVYAARGRPTRCQDCGRSDKSGRYDWANVSGNYTDVNDYIPLCKSCHNKYDGIVANLRRAG